MKAQVSFALVLTACGTFACSINDEPADGVARGGQASVAGATSGGSSAGTPTNVGGAGSGNTAGSVATAGAAGPGVGGGSGGAGGAGGSGGGSGGGAGSSGSGGSGVVILRMLTSNYSGITTGSPTVTTDGAYTVIKFTSSGTYTP